MLPNLSAQRQGSPRGDTSSASSNVGCSSAAAVSFAVVLRITGGGGSTQHAVRNTIILFSVAAITADPPPTFSVAALALARLSLAWLYAFRGGINLTWN
jgi:hypothetical protein